MHLGLGIGGERQRPRRDREIRAHVGERIVGGGGEGALLDRIGADGLAWIAGQSAGESVTVKEGAGGDLVGQGRIVIAVELALGIGSDGQESGSDRQSAVRQSERIVGEFVVRIVKAGDDGVGADRAVGVGGSGGTGGDVVAGLDAGERARERRVGCAIRPAQVVGDHAQGEGADGQGAVGEGDVVVGGGQAADFNRIHAERAVGGGGGGEDQGAAQSVGILAVDKAGEGGGEGRVGLAVAAGGVVCGDKQRRGGDGQGSRDVIDGVIGRGLAGGGDRIVADRAIGVGGGGGHQCAGDEGGILAIGETRVSDGEDRVGLAIEAGLVVGGAGQRGRRDVGGRGGGRIRRVIPGVRAAGGEAADGDGLAIAHVLVGKGGGGERVGEVIAADPVVRKRHGSRRVAVINLVGG